MKFVFILLGLCCFQQATTGVTHTLQYFYTATSGLPNFPEFVTLGVVDGQQIDHYDSITRKAIPKADWITGAVDADYFNRNTQTYAGTEATFKAGIDIVKQRFNQSGGVHTWMWMYGCQWNDENDNLDAFENWGYDGDDFVTFDFKNSRYIATTPESVITKHKWDSDKGLLTQLKNYLTNICPEWLKKYVKYGRTTLERKVAPEVTLIQKDSGVVCHSTGYYPDGVMITWKKDGAEIQEDMDVGETLPNEDGTFQKKVVLTVSHEERKKGQYTCEVAHKSGTIVETLVVDDGNSLGIIIGCVVVVALVVIGVIVAVVMKKKKDYKKAEQSDTDSDASNPTRT